ncbi:MAG: Spx/MgsR family RNA polymerase-binding regulatory protein [Synechococcus sp.]
MTVTIYGIPNCNSCKKALKWLENIGAQYEFVNLKEHPPTKEIILGWVNDLTAKPMRNTSGQAYRAIPTATRDAMTDEQWGQAFADNAMLLKRPLFVVDGVAVATGFRSPDSLRQTLGV